MVGATAVLGGGLFCICNDCLKRACGDFNIYVNAKFVVLVTGHGEKAFYVLAFGSIGTVFGSIQSSTARFGGRAPAISLNVSLLLPTGAVRVKTAVAWTSPYSPEISQDPYCDCINVNLLLVLKYSGKDFHPRHLESSKGGSKILK